jgi:trans-aconitate methyltransferase
MSVEVVPDAKAELDRNAVEYLEPSPDRAVDQKVIAMVADYVLPRLRGRRVLELGVGDRVWTPRLVDRFPHVTTVEGSSRLLRVMGRELAGKPWTPVCSLFEEYRPDEPFDTVVATGIFEHVADPPQLLGLVRQWLRPGGTLAVVVPHALSLHRRLAVKMGLSAFPGEFGETDRRLQHTHCFTCYDMERLLVEAGFRVREQKGLFCKSLPNGLLTRCSDQQLQGLFDLGLSLPIEYSAVLFFLAESPGR